MKTLAEKNSDAKVAMVNLPSALSVAALWFVVYLVCAILWFANHNPSTN